MVEPSLPPSLPPLRSPRTFPAGSGLTSRHYIQAVLAAALAGLSATAQSFPTPLVAGICHIGISVVGAVMLGLGLTTSSVSEVRGAEQYRRFNRYFTTQIHDKNEH